MAHINKNVDGRIMQNKHARTPSKQPDRRRKIYVNDAARNAGFSYINNKIRTSKYNMLSFLPRNLFEQFQRVANFYFLCFLILLLIPYLSPFMPIIFILPLGTVLAFTAVKDAYDDIERHRNDRRVNSRTALVLRNGVLIEEKWESIVVGDIIRLENDHFVTADILLLSTSEPHGLCYIETSELDGETNLKCRQCLSETAALGNNHQAIGVVKAGITCEAPNEILNRFEGVLKWYDDPHAAIWSDADDDNVARLSASARLLPLTNDQLLLRGCVLRNTQWCYGVVIFAGKDTKLMQNSGKTKHKRTTVDYLLNYIIVGIAMFLISLCVICSLSRNLWEIEYINFRRFMPWMQVTEDWKVEPRSVSGVASPIGVGQDIIKSLDDVIEQTKKNPKFDKLFGRSSGNGTNITHALSAIAQVAVGDVVIEPIVAVVAGVFPHATSSSSSGGGSNPSRIITASTTTNATSAVYGSDYMTIATISFFAFFSYAILMSGLVPISLYVSIEIVRLIHSWWINWDNQMCHNGEHARARSTVLSDELGQIEYIFSDKTGTLTQNIMTFKSCSIGGRMYGLLCDAYGNFRKPCATDRRVNFTERNRMADQSFTFFDHSLWQLVLDSKNASNSFNDLSSRAASPLVGRSPTPTQQQCDNLTLLPNDNSLAGGDTVYAVSQPNNFIESQQYSMTGSSCCDNTSDMFFRLLSICHTVMPGEKNGQLIYQAQSPDEGALVRAARNFGYVLCQRTPHSITVQQTLGEENELVFSLLAILDFNNARRRMSVLVRDPLLNNKIVLYTKGADSVVFERLADNAYNSRVKASTDEHLDRFASEGLRTLVLAYRVIEEAEFALWQKNYFLPASLAVADDRDDKLDEAYDRIEQNLTLLGATAIEDKLQDGVADTIANVLQAGIYVWVLTGDKMETAINIGYSCKLLTDHLETVFVIDATNDAAELQDQLLQAKYCIDQSSQQQHKQRTTVDDNDEYGKERKVGFTAAVVGGGGDYFSSSTTKTTPRHVVAVDSVDAADRDHSAQKVPLNNSYFEHAGDYRSATLRKNQCMPESIPEIEIAVHDAVDPPSNDSKQYEIHMPPNDNFAFGSSLSTIDDGTVGVVVHENPFFAGEKSREFADTAAARLPQTLNEFSAASDESPTPNSSGNDGAGFALVVNGSSLCQAMELGLIDLFLDIALKCKTVIVCRATPLQKALVVKLIRQRCQAVTLAIGDGANDVSMIKEAHVGVGISGQEGMQAVMASDFSIAQFRFLQRLLLVHGRWSYYRMSKFLRYFFYKNFACYLTHFFYAWYSGFTTLSVYDPWFLTFYNMFYTALPVLAMAAFDQDVDASNSSKFPQLYALGLRMRFFNYKTFFVVRDFFFIRLLCLSFVVTQIGISLLARLLQWAGGGSLTSFLLFYVVMLNFDDIHLLAPYHSFALALATILVLVVTVQICLDTEYWTWINLVTLIFSLASFFIFSALQSATTSPPQWQSQFLGVFNLLFFRCEFWLTTLLCIVLFSAPVIAIRCLDFELHPTMSSQIKWRQLAHVRMRSSRSLQLQAEKEWRRRRGPLRHESTRKRQQPSVRSSYAFSHEAGFARLITEGVNMRGSHSGLAVSSSTQRSNSANKQHVIKRIAKWPATAAAGLLSNLSLVQPLGSSLSTMMKRSTSDAGNNGGLAGSAAGSNQKSANYDTEENNSKNSFSSVQTAAADSFAETARDELGEIAVAECNALSTSSTDLAGQPFSEIDHSVAPASSSSLARASMSSLTTVMLEPTVPEGAEYAPSTLPLEKQVPYTTSRATSPDRHFDITEQVRLRSTSVDRPASVRKDLAAVYSCTLTSNIDSPAYIRAEKTVKLPDVMDSLWLSSSADQVGLSSMASARDEPQLGAARSSCTLPKRLQSPVDTQQQDVGTKKKNVRFNVVHSSPSKTVKADVENVFQYRPTAADVAGAAQRPTTLAMQKAAAAGVVFPPGGSSLASRHTNILHLQQLAAAKKRQQQQLLQEEQSKKSDYLTPEQENVVNTPPALPLSSVIVGEQLTEFISTLTTRVAGSKTKNNSISSRSTISGLAKEQNAMPDFSIPPSPSLILKTKENEDSLAQSRTVTPIYDGVLGQIDGGDTCTTAAETPNQESIPSSYKKGDAVMRSVMDTGAGAAAAKMSPISAALWKLAGFATGSSSGSKRSEISTTSVTSMSQNESTAQSPLEVVGKSFAESGEQNNDAVANNKAV